MCIWLKQELEWHKSGIIISSLHYFLAESLKYWRCAGISESTQSSPAHTEQAENLLIVMSHFSISPLTVLRWSQLSCKRHFVICECALRKGSCLLIGWQDKLCVHVCLIQSLWAHWWFLVLYFKKWDSSVIQQKKKWHSVVRMQILLKYR